MQKFGLPIFLICVVLLSLLSNWTHAEQRLPPKHRACHEAFTKKVGACVENQLKRNPRKLPDWERCQSRFQYDKDACLEEANVPSDRGNKTHACIEAKKNIDWVLFRDKGAQRRFRSFRWYANGEEKNTILQSILQAQAHNKNAQASIRRCSTWALTYISGLVGRGVLED